MKVCHFEASLGIGRGEFYVDLANNMACEHDRVSEVLLLTPVGTRYAHRVHPRVRHLQYTAGNSRCNPALWWELVRIIRRESPAIVHTHFNKATGIFRRLSRFVDIPWVATKHNNRRAAVYDRVPNVTAVSAQAAASVGRPDVKVISNGVDAQPTNLVLPESVPEPVRLLAVGRLVAVKGFHRLIDSLAQTSLPWTLSIVGEGEEEERLRSLIARLHLGEKVRLLGFREDVPELMRSHDAVIVSSESEGCCMSLIEGLFHAPLVLSTPVGVAPQVLPPELILRHDHMAADIECRLGDYPLARTLFRSCLGKAHETLTLNACVRQYLQLYERILSS